MPITTRSAIGFVIFIGLTSLFADMTYEGARSINGPFLALLGASATIVVSSPVSVSLLAMRSDSPPVSGATALAATDRSCSSATALTYWQCRCWRSPVIGPLLPR
jgi:hypothetical protein